MISGDRGDSWDVISVRFPYKTSICKGRGAREEHNDISEYGKSQNSGDPKKSGA